MNEIQWYIVENDSGRRVYQMRIPEKYAFVISGIIDYDPARPRFKAVAKFPDIHVEWYDTLEDAKDFLVAEYARWVLSK